METIDILLATYNAEKNVNDLIDSLINQSYKNIRLIIRDDVSTDSTREIINNYLEDGLIYIEYLNINSYDSNKNLGVVENFEYLLSKSTSDYIMFCDQDDVWLPDKVEKTYARMKELEHKYPDMPLLVHTDLEVVDPELNTISKSYYKYMNIDPYRNKINNLLVENNVTGCTVMINRKLADIALPFGKDVLMHDWYLALVASYKGIIDYIPEPTIKYRQHSSNKVGARAFDLKYMIGKLLYSDIIKSIRLSQKQAAIIKDNDLAGIYGNLNKYSFIKRRYMIIRYGFWKTGIIKNLGLLCLI